MKFKVGDKVKVTHIEEQNTNGQPPIGHIGIIGEITKFGYMLEGYSMFMYEGELELVEKYDDPKLENDIIYNQSTDSYILDEPESNFVKATKEMVEEMINSFTKYPYQFMEGSKTTEEVKESLFKKFDSGKPMMGLIPPKAELEVAKVLTEGAKKYSPDNWKKCDDFTRYMDAALRHINVYRQGNKIDDGEGGTNTNHLANAIVSLMFILEKDLESE